MILKNKPGESPQNVLRSSRLWFRGRRRRNPLRLCRIQRIVGPDAGPWNTGTSSCCLAPEIARKNTAGCPASAVGGGRWTVDGGRWAVDGGRWTVGGGRWVVGGGWCARLSCCAISTGRIHRDLPTPEIHSAFPDVTPQPSVPAPDEANPYAVAVKRTLHPSVRQVECT